MKTIILSFLLIFGITVTNHGKPINDIYSIKDPLISPEPYVDDIPFNTLEIAVEAIFEGDKVELEDEAYIDDIPFDTRAIACEYYLREMIENSGEANINDIPFRTDRVFCEYMAARLTQEYRTEKMVNDLPEYHSFVVSSLDHGVSNCFSGLDISPRQPIFRQRKINDFNYSIIYPVKLELPELELNNEVIENENLLKTGFSL